MKKLVLVLLLAAMVIAPIGCRAVMVASEASVMAIVGVIDPGDSGSWWEDFGDYLENATKSIRRNVTDMHRTFDRHIMGHDWDDPTL